MTRKSTDFYQCVIARSRAEGGRRSNPISNFETAIKAAGLDWIASSCSRCSHFLAMTRCVIITIVLLFTQPANAEILCVNAPQQCLTTARDIFLFPHETQIGTTQYQTGQGGPNVTGPHNGGTWHWQFSSGSATGRHWCSNNARTANGTACWCQITRFSGVSCVNEWGIIAYEDYHINHPFGWNCLNNCAGSCASNLMRGKIFRERLINMTCVACDDCSECGAGWAPAPASTEMYTPRTRNCPNRPRGSGIVTCQ